LARSTDRPLDASATLRQTLPIALLQAFDHTMTAASAMIQP